MVKSLRRDAVALLELRPQPLAAVCRNPVRAEEPVAPADVIAHPQFEFRTLLEDADKDGCSRLEAGLLHFMNNGRPETFLHLGDPVGLRSAARAQHSQVEKKTKDEQPNNDIADTSEHALK